MAQSTTFDFTVEAGTTFTVDFFCKEDADTAMDLTGWSARMHVRSAYGAPGTPLMSFDSAGNGLVITAAAGQIRLTIAPADTNDIPAPAAGRALKYDLEIEDSGGVVYRPFKGTLTLMPQITIE